MQARQAGCAEGPRREGTIMDLTELIEALGIKDDHWCGAYIPEEWAAIVIPLMAALKEEGATICQVKGKFGGLRVYINGGSEEAQSMIRQAEEQVWAIDEAKEAE
jgi:hypothetical protein